MQVFPSRSICSAIPSVLSHQSNSKDLIQAGPRLASDYFLNILRSRQAGTAILEAAIIMPVLLALCAGLLSLASFLRDDVILERALRGTSLSIARYDPAKSISTDPIQVCAEIKAIALDFLEHEGLKSERFNVEITAVTIGATNPHLLQRIGFTEKTAGQIFGLSAPKHDNVTAVVARSSSLPITCPLS